MEQHHRRQAFGTPVSVVKSDGPVLNMLVAWTKSFQRSLPLFEAGMLAGTDPYFKRIGLN